MSPGCELRHAKMDAKKAAPGDTKNFASAACDPGGRGYTTWGVDKRGVR